MLTINQGGRGGGGGGGGGGSDNGIVPGDVYLPLFLQKAALNAVAQSLKFFVVSRWNSFNFRSQGSRTWGRRIDLPISVRRKTLLQNSGIGTNNLMLSGKQYQQGECFVCKLKDETYGRNMQTQTSLFVCLWSVPLAVDDHSTFPSRENYSSNTSFNFQRSISWRTKTICTNWSKCKEHRLTYLSSTLRVGCG